MNVTACGECGKQVRFRNDQVGLEASCPGCGAPMTLAPSQPPLESATVAGKSGSGILVLLSLALAMFACVVSVVSIGWVMLSNPLGKGLDAYDFSTPKDALRSRLEILSKNDVRAVVELQLRRNAARNAEKHKSLVIHKESSYQDMKILFISYERNGLTVHDVEGFEKDVDSGMWFSKYVSTFSMKDNDLKNAIRKWKARDKEVKAG